MYNHTGIVKSYGHLISVAGFLESGRFCLLKLQSLLYLKISTLPKHVKLGTVCMCTVDRSQIVLVDPIGY